jgi:hypothetical protein
MSKEINRQAVQSVIKALISPLKEKYDDLGGVIDHLDAVEANLCENFDRIKMPDEVESPLNFSGAEAIIV